mmetsp:Transcript_43281/g.110733  ORF Transcript_43281/g.110733 Transcript_43281/m.110733 type:complete len:382 (-) Transcript_43281:22-1167(-)
MPRELTQRVRMSCSALALTPSPAAIPAPASCGSLRWNPADSRSTLTTSASFCLLSGTSSPPRSPPDGRSTGLRGSASVSLSLLGTPPPPPGALLGVTPSDMGDLGLSAGATAARFRPLPGGSPAAPAASVAAAGAAPSALRPPTLSPRPPRPSAGKPAGRPRAADGVGAASASSSPPSPLLLQSEPPSLEEMTEEEVTSEEPAAPAPPFAAPLELSSRPTSNPPKAAARPRLGTAGRESLGTSSSAGPRRVRGGESMTRRLEPELPPPRCGWQAGPRGVLLFGSACLPGRREKCASPEAATTVKRKVLHLDHRKRISVRVSAPQCNNHFKPAAQVWLCQSSDLDASVSSPMCDFNPPVQHLATVPVPRLTITWRCQPLPTL